jgi:hypothetical protein
MKTATRGFIRKFAAYGQVIAVCCAGLSTLRADDTNSSAIFHLPAHLLVHAKQPRWTAELPSLGPGAIYDMRGYLKVMGIDLATDAQALYSPAKQLLFVRADAKSLEFIDALLVHPPYPVYRLTVHLRVAAAGEISQAPKLAISFPAKSGQLSSVTWGRNSENSLEIEPMVGADGKTVDINMALTLVENGTPYKFMSGFPLRASKEANLSLRPADPGTSRQQPLTATISIDIEEEPPVDNAALSRALIRQIESEIKIVAQPSKSEP